MEGMDLSFGRNLSDRGGTGIWTFAGGKYSAGTGIETSGKPQQGLGMETLGGVGPAVE
jgi:hypothetical protein